MSSLSIKATLPIDFLYRGSPLNDQQGILEKAKGVVDEFIPVIDGKMVTSAIDKDRVRRLIDQLNQTVLVNPKECSQKKFRLLKKEKITQEYAKNEEVNGAVKIEAQKFLSELNLNENKLLINLKNALETFALNITKTDFETTKLINKLLVELRADLKSLRFIAKNLQNSFEGNKNTFYPKENENDFKEKREAFLADYREWLQIAETYQKLLELREKHLDSETQRELISIIWLNQIQGEKDGFFLKGVGIKCLKDRMDNTIKNEENKHKKTLEEFNESEVVSEIPLPDPYNDLQNLASRAAAIHELLKVEDKVIYLFNSKEIKSRQDSIKDQPEIFDRLPILDLILRKIEPKKEKYSEAYFSQAKLLQEELVEDFKRVDTLVKNKLVDLEEGIKQKKEAGDRDLKLMVCTKKLMELGLGDVKNNMACIASIVNTRELSLTEQRLESEVYEATPEQKKVVSIFNKVASESLKVKHESLWVSQEELKDDQLKGDLQSRVLKHRKMLSELSNSLETLPDLIKTGTMTNFNRLAETGAELLTVRKLSEELKSDLKKLKERTDALNEWKLEPQLAEPSSSSSFVEEVKAS